MDARYLNPQVVFRIQSRTPGQHRGVEGEDKDKGKNMKDKDTHKDNKEKDKDGGRDGGEAEAVANDSLKDEVDDKPTEISYYVRLRPGVREFLEKVAELYEVSSISIEARSVRYYMICMCELGFPLRCSRLQVVCTGCGDMPVAPTAITEESSLNSTEQIPIRSWS